MTLNLDEINLTLANAFNFLGQHLYASQWTGQELSCAPLLSPQDLNAKRAPIEKQVTKLEKQMDATPDNKQDLTKTRNGLLNELWEIGEADEAYQDRYQIYERKLETEKVLLNGLTSKSLTANLTSGADIPIEVWRGSEGFEYDIDLSQVTLPKFYANKPQQAAHINQKALKAWLRDIKPIIKEAKAKTSPNDQCRIFLKEKIELGGKDKTRDEYKAEAMSQITGLSHRAFNQVWAEIIPEGWKKAGRPRK